MLGRKAGNCRAPERKPTRSGPGSPLCTLEADTEVIYKVTNYCAPDYDHGLLWNDPALAIDWPVSEPLLSEKDRDHPPLGELPEYFSYKPIVNG